MKSLRVLFPILSIVLFQFFFLTMETQGATLLFFENFESGSLGNCAPQGTGGDTSHISATTDNARGEGSNWSAKIIYQYSDNLQRLRCAIPTNRSGELFVRFYYRYNSDFHIHYNHKLGRFIEANDTYPAQQMELQKFASSYKVMGMGAAVNQYFSGPDVNTGWHKYEIFIKYNSSSGSSDGTIKVWIDGELKVNLSENAKIITEDPVSDYIFRYLYLPDNYADSPDTSDTYQVDDIEVWDGMPSGGPTVEITSPTGVDTYQTSNPSVNLAGAALDDVAVTGVTWSNSTGENGTASGTSVWSIADIALVEGSNVLTVKATDSDGNEGIRTLTATYTPYEPTPEFVFSDNFDDGDVSDWNDHHQNVILIDNQQTYNNSPYSVHLSHNPGSTNTGNLAIFFADNPTSSNSHQCSRLDEVYVEYFVRFSSASSWPSTSTKLSKLESWPVAWASNTTKNFYLTTEIDSSGRFISTVNRIKGDNPGYYSYPQNQGTIASIHPNVWHEVKIRAKTNTPGEENGIIQMWIDDILVTSYENIVFCTIDAGYGWNTFGISGYDNPSSPDDKQQYWDDLTISSTDIVQPTSQLGPPANLRILQ